MLQFHEITCEHDGVPLKGYYARPANGGASAPGVFAIPGASGGVTRMKMTVTKLAELGFVAAAVCMYDAREDTTDEMAAAKHFMELLAAPDMLRARTRAWFDAIAALPGVDPARIGALGYCFGGQCVLELARSGADVKATVAYHGLLRTHAPALPGMIKGHVAAWCAGRDPYVPLEDIDGFRKEMGDAGVAHQVTIFSEAQHAFTDPDAASHAREGIAYDALSEEISWAGTVALLKRQLSCA